MSGSLMKYNCRGEEQNEDFYKKVNELLELTSIIFKK